VSNFQSITSADALIATERIKNRFGKKEDNEYDQHQAGSDAQSSMPLYPSDCPIFSTPNAQRGSQEKQYKQKNSNKDNTFWIVAQHVMPIS